MAVSDHTAGLGDDAMLAATGKHPDEWFALLDARGATGWTHTEIARWLVAQHEGLDGWWAQSVTVRYEQARGMRLPGQRADGTFEVSASKTLPRDQLDALRTAVDTLARTYGDPASQNTTAKFPTARWKLDHGQNLVAMAAPSKNGRTSLTLTWSRLPDANAASAAKDTAARLLANVVESLD